MDKIDGKSFLKKLLGFSAASWISAAISFLSTPFITRFFLPEDVGKVNIFLTILVLFQTISILGLDQAFMRFYTDLSSQAKKNGLFTYCLRISILMSSLCAIVVLVFNKFFSNQIAGTYNFEIIIYLAVSIFSSSILRMTSIKARMEKNIISYTFQTISTSFIEKVLFVLVAFYKSSYSIVLLAICCGYFIISVLFLFINRKSISVHIHLNKAFKIAILKFSIPYLPVLLLAWLNNSIPQFFLKQYVDYSAVGIYTNAVTIANILTIIQTGFTVYWSPFAYENYQNNAEKLKKVHVLITFILIAFGLLIILSQDFIYLLLGVKFRMGKMFFPFLLFSPICNSIADTTGIGVMISKKSYLNLYTFIASTSTNIIFCFLLIPVFGVAGAAIAAAIAAIIMLIVRTYLGQKHYKVCDNIFQLILGLSMLLISSISNLLIGNQIIKYFAVILSYLLLMLVYINELKYLITFIKKIILDTLKLKRRN
ncbi:oligosaccharide flippase family protein [[Clostridium] innocuum]|nr:oligosaccharide flippase family protein [[Clostridium] innocuum]